MNAGSYCLECRMLDCAAHMANRPHLSRGQVKLLRALLDPDISGHGELAYRLGLSVGTIKIYLHRLYESLGWKRGDIRLATLYAAVHAAELGGALPSSDQFETALRRRAA